MKVPVIHRSSKRDKGSCYILDVEELLFLSVDQPNVVFHTRDQQFYLRSALEDWKIILEAYPFEELDRGVLVHTAKIRKIDVERRLIYFNDSNTEAHCTISAAKLKQAQENYNWVKFLRD